MDPIQKITKGNGKEYIATALTNNSMALNDSSATTTHSLSRVTTLFECRFSRSAGAILLAFALIALLVNLHALQTHRRTMRVARRDRHLVFGMFASSLCVIIISVPSVVIQCFLCRRLSLTLICQVEGFNSFFNGCMAMYMLVALSVVRYVTTANSSLSQRLQRRIEDKSSYLVLICLLLSSLWAVPPLFGRGNAYVPEGLGFHCGLNWCDRSLPSRIYFLLLFINVYFLPLIFIAYVNIYIQRTVHRLTHLCSTVPLEFAHLKEEDALRRHASQSQYDRERRRLQYLNQDRRFVLATSISVLIYLIAWSPYSIVALAQVFGDLFSLYNPWLMTTWALLAKLSMISNPIIYTILLRTREMPIVTARLIWSL